ncbi:unnamed protein product [Blepharisma stoltei]|uniref:Uncharacterized protein n=1 Tax=Blepharisma stoltei TaxID=1481888 RepID=A0AAU9JNZ0_9CILI|nr:unnamed protein product [Blepharisma stoltei]
MCLRMAKRKKLQHLDIDDHGESCWIKGIGIESQLIVRHHKLNFGNRTCLFDFRNHQVSTLAIHKGGFLGTQ